MNRADDILDQSIKRISDGESADDVINEIPADLHELAPLVNLARAINKLDKPLLNSDQILLQRKGVIAAAQSFPQMTQPSRRFHFGRLFSPVSFAVFASIAMITLLLGFGFFLFIKNPVNGQAVTIIDMSGQVEVSGSGYLKDWQTVSSGQKVKEGQYIRTGFNSFATLLLSNGSRVMMNSFSEVELTQLSSGKDKSIQVFLNQSRGNVVYTVTPLGCESCYFQVETPSGVASVHGTIFDVDIALGGAARYSVQRGEVSIKNQNSEVMLTAGQATTTFKKNPPDTPAYEFVLNGKLTAANQSSWTVAGTVFTMPTNTTGNQVVQLGEYVAVKGRILHRNEWIADRITFSKSENEKAIFTGLVDEINDDKWVVGGRPLWITAEGQHVEGLRVGSPVEVRYTVLEDGRWIAEKIKNLQEPSDDMSSLTATMSPVDVMTEAVTIGETKTVSPSATFFLTEEVNRAGCHRVDKHQPEGLKLSAEFSVSYEEIMTWFCKGYGFGEIKQAYDLQKEYKKTVQELFALRASGLGWGQIKHELAPKPIKEATKVKVHKPTMKPKK